MVAFRIIYDFFHVSFWRPFSVFWTLRTQVSQHRTKTIDVEKSVYKAFLAGHVTLNIFYFIYYNESMVSACLV